MSRAVTTIRYETEYSEHLQKNFPGYWNGSFKEFRRCRETLSKCTKRGIWGSYESWLIKHCKTFATELDSSTVFVLNEKCLSLFPGSVDCPTDPYNDFIATLMRMCVPNTDPFFPHLFKKSSDFAKARRLLASLERSALINASKAARLSLVTGAGAAGDGAAKKSGKKRSKGTESPWWI